MDSSRPNSIPLSPNTTISLSPPFPVFHYPLKLNSKPALTVCPSLCNGGSRSHLEESSSLVRTLSSTQRPPSWARHRSCKGYKAVGRSRQMGLPRSEEDNSARAVAPEGGRRCLRGAKRRLGGSGHSLRWRLRLGRLGPPWRSQQDHSWLLL